MRFAALATDYDGTLAHDGRVDAPTVTALERLRASGRRLLLVTGRELDELLGIFPEISLFDRVVAENGALLYTPATGARRLLGDPPPERFVQALRARGVPISVGGSIVATVRPHETAVLEAIRDLGLELTVVFNKGAVMVLPSGVNKASGLAVALADLALSPRNTVAVGDGENDHALLDQAELGVAVANAVATLRTAADHASPLDHGKGVVELIDALLADDLAAWTARRTRRTLSLGRNEGGEVCVPAHGTRLLVAGAAGTGKLALTRALLARIARHGYQFCVLDPAGRFGEVEGAVTVGNAERAPGVEEVLAALESPEASLVVQLGALPAAERTRFLHGLLPRLGALVATLGRPHWLVLDDAHHFLPREVEAPGGEDVRLPGTIAVTAHVESMYRSALASFDAALVLGEHAPAILSAAGIHLPPHDTPSTALAADEALVWQRAQPHRVERVRVDQAHPGASAVRPPRRGDVAPAQSFHFRGPDGALDLRAQNLALFLQIGEGVDDRTWLFHLRRGDYSRWLRSAFADDALAAEVAAVERSPAVAAAESRARVRQAIAARYPLVAQPADA